MKLLALILALSAPGVLAGNACLQGAYCDIWTQPVFLSQEYLKNALDNSGWNNCQEYGCSSDTSLITKWYDEGKRVNCQLQVTGDYSGWSSRNEALSFFWDIWQSSINTESGGDIWVKDHWGKQVAASVHVRIRPSANSWDWLQYDMTCSDNGSSKVTPCTLLGYVGAISSLVGFELAWLGAASTLCSGITGGRVAATIDPPPVANNTAFAVENALRFQASLKKGSIVAFNKTVSWVSSTPVNPGEVVRQVAISSGIGYDEAIELGIHPQLETGQWTIQGPAQSFVQVIVSDGTKPATRLYRRESTCQTELNKYSTNVNKTTFGTVNWQGKLISFSSQCAISPSEAIRQVYISQGVDFDKVCANSSLPALHDEFYSTNTYCGSINITVASLISSAGVKATATGLSALVVFAAVCIAQVLFGLSI